ncbi:hypothetical protein R69746_08634 [Paraburkholderia aspalathi]|nr:hypothetical protein R69746_08634 [Paraburkholderia aspalathi]
MAASMLSHKREVLGRQRGQADQFAFILGESKQLESLRRGEQFAAGQDLPRRAQVLIQRFATDAVVTSDLGLALSGLHATAQLGDFHVGQ